jgi:hypothetical protein
MLSDLTGDQRALADYMSMVSEEAFAASWLVDIEHLLWRAIEEPGFHHGRLMLTPQQSRELRVLSQRCDGWIYFDEVKGESFVRLDTWREEIYDRRRTL